MHFQLSLANGDFGSAWAYATSLSHVELADALRLTCLSLKNHPKRFEPLARRWLARYIDKAPNSPTQTSSVELLAPASH